MHKIFLIICLCIGVIFDFFNYRTLNALSKEQPLKITGSDREDIFVLNIQKEGLLGECEVLNTSKKDEITVFVRGASIESQKASMPIPSSYLPRVLLQNKGDGVIITGKPTKRWERFSIDRGNSSISIIFHLEPLQAKNTTQKLESAPNSEKEANITNPVISGDEMATVISARKPKAYMGQPISMDFVDADIKNVLRLIAELAGLNLAVDPDVTGKVTIKFEQVPWDQVMDIILETNHLDVKPRNLWEVKLKGGVIRVAKKERLNAELAEELEIIRRMALLEHAKLDEGPLETAYIPIHYLSGTSFDREELLWTVEKANPTVPTGVGTVLRETGGGGGGLETVTRTAKEGTVTTTKIEQGGAGTETKKELGTVPIERSYKKDPIILTLIKPFLSDKGSAVFDFNNKLLIVTDYRSRIERIKQIIANVDVPPKQIKLEARIVVANQNFGKSLGVNWGFNYFNIGEAFRRGQRYYYPKGFDPNDPNSGFNYNDPTNPKTIDPTKPDPIHRVDPSKSSTYYNPGFSINLPMSALNFGWGLLTGQNLFAIDMNIQAAQTRNLAKLVSSPIVYVINNREAYVTQGIDYPYPEIGEEGRITIRYRKVEVALRVIPSLTPDNRILMAVQLVHQQLGQEIPLSYLDPRSPVNTQLLARPFPTRKVDTYLMVDDGAVIVLGGVLDTRWSKTKLSTPGLEKIPVLGNLFKRKDEDFSQDELLVFISPKVIEHSKTSSLMTK